MPFEGINRSTACWTRSGRDLASPILPRGGQPERSDLGHVFVFDFDGITRWPDKARWDMVAGCENPDAAQSRAAAIVNARPAGSAGMKDSAH